VLDLAWRAAVPVYAVSHPRHPTTLATLASHRPDLICVACFPRRVHPSLLPAGRGPDPRFWAFRHGLARGGVTIHQMTDDLDAGPILAQAAFDLPDGLTGAAFDEQAGRLGGDLLVQVARAMAAGTARPMPQDPAGARYDPWPSAADYLVSTDRPARWAYRFINGVAGDGGPLAVWVAGRAVPVSAALAYDAERSLGAPFVHEGDAMWVQFTPGALLVRPLSTAGDESWVK
jgi:methionyl-tRNA formyltransferase